MAKKSIKKVSFQMDATQASKARDFLMFALSRRTPDEYSTRKTAARKLAEQLNMALRIELGEDDGMRDHYDFSKGVRGKYAGMMKNGYTITIHEEDGSSRTAFYPNHENVHFRKMNWDCGVGVLFPIRDAELTDEALTMKYCAAFCEYQKNTPLERRERITLLAVDGRGKVYECGMRGARPARSSAMTDAFKATYGAFKATYGGKRKSK